MVWKGRLLLSSQQLLVGLLHIQLGQQEGDQGAEDGGQPQIHDIQHGDDGLGLRGSTARDEACGSQQPAGDHSAQTAADLDTQDQQVELVLDQQASVLLSYSVPSMMYHTTNFDQRSYRHPTAQR